MHIKNGAHFIAKSKGCPEVNDCSCWEEENNNMNLKITPIANSEQENELEIKLYPNPAMNELNIQFNNYFYSVSKIEISNIEGKLLINKNNDIRKNNFFNISEFSKGIYFAKIYTNKKKIVKKFIKN